ncbi:MAG TPA: hypothetical protein VKA46_36765 [Gemmataceae bacterium]|nr:hypothetical protein [Gemmataceae bacterium]
MKTIDLGTASLTLKKLLQLAGEENVVLRTADGRTFVLAEIDDFADEVVRVAQNRSLMALLDERSKEAPAHSLDEVRKQLKAK